MNDVEYNEHLHLCKVSKFKAFSNQEIFIWYNNTAQRAYMNMNNIRKNISYIYCSFHTLHILLLVILEFMMMI